MMSDATQREVARRMVLYSQDFWSVVLHLI